jgi:predicted acetyltransferase
MWLSGFLHIIHFDSERGLNVAALDENRPSLSTKAAMNSLNSSNSLNSPADIRPIAAEEVAEFQRCLGIAFGRIDPPGHLSTWAALLDPQRCLAALDGGDMVGGTAVVTLGITVPGTIVPTGALVAAAIAPTHRRQGLLRTMMQRHLHDMHDRGEVLSALWTSEWPIYGRFGYGVATLATRYEIDPARAKFARPPCPAAAGRVSMVDAETALAVMPTVYDRVRATQVGAPERPTLWWRHLFSDTESRRQGFSPLQFVLHHSDAGEADGYAAYRIKGGQDADDLATSQVRILELMAASPEAYEALWHFCLNIDLVMMVEAENRPVDDAVIHLLADGRRLRRRISDGMWLRLVDVPAALRLRHYRTAGALTLRLEDAVCPWNQGNFRLEATPSGAECVPTDGEPDLELGVAELAGAYLGTSPLHAMAGAQRVHELTPGALAAADTLFAWTPAPWCPNVF